MRNTLNTFHWVLVKIGVLIEYPTDFEDERTYFNLSNPFAWLCIIVVALLLAIFAFLFVPVDFVQGIIKESRENKEIHQHSKQ